MHCPRCEPAIDDCIAGADCTLTDRMNAVTVWRRNAVPTSKQAASRQIPVYRVD